METIETSVFRTEYPFELPRGYVDLEGTCHKKGIMRLAKTCDEILCQQDPRVVSNPSYSICIVLSRVITKLGDLGPNDIYPKTIENFYLSDLTFLKNLYQQINFDESLKISCPHCQNKFNLELQNLD